VLAGAGAFQRQRAAYQRVVQRFGDFAFLGNRRVNQVAEVEVAVADVADEEIGMPLASTSATDSSRQSARREIGTQVSVEIARQPGRDWMAAK
jgi:hypothetical protein